MKFIDDTRGQAMTSPTWPLYLVVVASIILVWEVAKDAAAWASTVTIDGATAALLTWATTPTVSPLVLALLVVGATGLTAVIVWTWENPHAGLKDDTRGQGFRTPHGLRLLTIAIAVVATILANVKNIETIQPSPARPTRPTRFEYLLAHPESLLYSGIITLWLVSAVLYAQNVHEWGESTDE